MSETKTSNLDRRGVQLGFSGWDTRAPLILRRRALRQHLPATEQIGHCVALALVVTHISFGLRGHVPALAAVSGETFLSFAGALPFPKVCSQSGVVPPQSKNHRQFAGLRPESMGDDKRFSVGSIATMQRKSLRDERGFRQWLIVEGR